MTQSLSQFLKTGRIIVHLGAHKTASTYIHQIVSDQKDALRAVNTSAILPSDLRGQDVLLRPAWGTGWEAESQTRVRTFIEGHLAETGAKDLLFCEENTIGSPRKVLKTGVLYADFGRRIMTLPAELNHPNVTFLFAIRDYGAFFSSCVTTALRRGIMFDLDALRASLIELPRRWGHVIAELTSTFPDADLKLWRYEDFNAIEAQVLSQFRVSVPEKSSKTSMQTMSQRAVEMLMREHAGIARIPQARKQVRAAQLAHPIGPDCPSFRLWGPSEAAEITQLYDEDFSDIAAVLPTSIMRP